MRYLPPKFQSIITFLLNFFYISSVLEVSNDDALYRNNVFFYIIYIYFN